MTLERTDSERLGDAAGGRLRRGRVLVVGVGGLGSAAALALAEAGVGTLGLIDGDRVELSNLQRQVIHSGRTIGAPKVDSAAGTLARRFPRLEVRPLPRALDADGAAELFPSYDFVVDGTDGAAAKFLINDAAVATGTAYSYAGAVGWLGQAMTVIPGETACLRCLFPQGADEADDLTCRDGGILGSVVGTLGALQAGEAVAFLSSGGDLRRHRLSTYDALAARWRSVPVYRNPRCPVCAERALGTADRTLEGGLA